MKRCFLVVIDSLGVGEAPDAKQYGDEGVNTLGNVAKHVQGVDLPTFDKLGFGKITNVLGLGTEHNATVGRLSEVSRKRLNLGALGNCRFNYNTGV